MKKKTLFFLLSQNFKIIGYNIFITGKHHFISEKWDSNSKHLFPDLRKHLPELCQRLAVHECLSIHETASPPHHSKPHPFISKQSIC